MPAVPSSSSEPPQDSEENRLRAHLRRDQRQAHLVPEAETCTRGIVAPSLENCRRCISARMESEGPAKRNRQRPQQHLELRAQLRCNRQLAAIVVGALAVQLAAVGPEAAAIQVATVGSAAHLRCQRPAKRNRRPAAVGPAAAVQVVAAVVGSAAHLRCQRPAQGIDASKNPGSNHENLEFLKN